MKGCKRSFSVIEYAVLIAVLVAALLGTSIYLKRSLSGKWREVGDTFAYGRQYDPQHTTFEVIHNQVPDCSWHRCPPGTRLVSWTVTAISPTAWWPHAIAQDANGVLLMEGQHCTASSWGDWLSSSLQCIEQ